MRDLTKPSQPSTAIQDRMAAETEERRVSASPAAALPEGSGAPGAARTALAETIDALANELLALSHAIHEHPEVGYEERFACSTVAEFLRRHGIEPEVGVFGMETALRAEFTSAAASDDDATNHSASRESSAPGQPASDGPRPTTPPSIAILAEYDALPGIGHGCGHNVMCANSVGAFVALAELERARPGAVPGRVVLQTTPAEESDTAKERLAIAGAFEDVEAAIQTHSYSSDLVHQTWLGVRRMRAVFTGVPAHASSQPFMGRNALDAASLTLQGIGLLRQQILPMDRVHAIILDGGAVANIIPERTELSIFVRSKYPETLKDLVGRIEDVLRGAALMTGTGVEIIAPEYTNEMPVRTNTYLAQSWVRSQRERGRDPLPFGVIPENIAAGTDFGNVSQRIPGIHPLIQVAPQGVALHTRGMTEAGESPEGDRACIDGAYGLAAVALDFLSDAELRGAVVSDFEASGGRIDVESFWETD